MSKLTLSSIEVVGRPGQLLVVDVRVDIHLPGVDLHDPGPGLLGGGGELDLPVQSARPEQSRVKNVNSVCSSDNLEDEDFNDTNAVVADLVVYLDIIIRRETVQLIEQLQHSSLHLPVSSLL